MLARARLGVVRAWGWRARGILRAVEARASPRMVYALSTPLIGCWVIEPIETRISLIDGGFRGSPGAISLIDGGSRRRNEPRGHLFAPLTLVFCKGAAIYKRDTNCHPAKSATHKRDVFSWVWHEASPYFDTPVAMLIVIMQVAIIQTDALAWSSLHVFGRTGVLRNGGERHNVRRHAENGKNKNGGIPTFFHARYNKTN